MVFKSCGDSIDADFVMREISRGEEVVNAMSLIMGGIILIQSSHLELGTEV